MLIVKDLSIERLDKKIFENINWKNYITNMGAPNMGGKSLLVKAYEETKKFIKLES